MCDSREAGRISPGDEASRESTVTGCAPCPSFIGHPVTASLIRSGKRCFEKKMSARCGSRSWPKN